MVKGGLGLRLTGVRSTDATVNDAARIRSVAAPAIAALSSDGLSSATPSNAVGCVVSVAPSPVSTSTSTVQYSRGANASISASRSEMSRSATDCTRPAERQPGTLRHSTGESPNPTR